jgi:hypothetical protein
MSEEFEKRTRELLEESSGRLDGRTRSRLTQARYAALEGLQKPQRRSFRRFVPAGAAAAVAVLAVVMLHHTPDTDAVAALAQSTSPAEDAELLTDADAADFTADGEDLEFYEWAAGELES